MPLASGWPGNRDADSHSRKNAENVPVFREIFGYEIEFGAGIVGIVDTSRPFCEQCDFSECHRQQANIATRDDVRRSFRIDVVERFRMYGTSARHLVGVVTRGKWASFFDEGYRL
jgi:hypothetical protein